MDAIQNLAIKIARRVVPSEIFQAPLLAENFVKGGKSRKALLQPAGAGELGGFGNGGAALLPWIFHAMAIAAPFLTGFLASRTIENASSIIKAIHAALDAHTSPPQDQKQTDQLQMIPQPLQQCVGVMAKTLQKAGLPLEESESIAYQTVLVLWEDVPSTFVFLHKITENK